MNTGLQALSDRELVALITTRSSEAASTELFQRYRNRIFSWCFQIHHDPEEAGDLTQEIFIRVFRGLPGFDHRSRFSTWVYKVTRNHCLSVLSTRKNQWHKRLRRLEGLDVEETAFARSRHRAEVTGEVEKLVSAAGRLMPDQELEAFVLHYRDGLSVKEISGTLGCTNSTGARTLIQNARRKFRRMTA